jgi:hypothetical protein
MYDTITTVYISERYKENQEKHQFQCSLTTQMQKLVLQTKKWTELYAGGF